MEFETLEQIVNLFERCRSEGKALQINIDEDLLKILPLPRKLLVDLLSNELISTFFRLSTDQKTLYYENNLRLCSIDQNEGGSCHSSSCEQLHLCDNYLLNKNCSQFSRSGQCSRPHSLSTHHNENILQKYNLSSKDDRTFSLVSRLIQLSLTNSSKIILQTINGQNISDRLINQWLGEHQSLLKSHKLINANTVQLIFDDDEVASMMEDYINQHHFRTVIIKKDFSSDFRENELPSMNAQENHSLFNESPPPIRPSFGRGRGRTQTNEIPLLNNSSGRSSFSQRLASNSPNAGRKFTLSQRLNSTQIRTKPTENLTTNSTNNQTKQHDKRFSNDTNSFYLPELEEKRRKSPPIEENKEITSSQYHNSKTRFVLHETSTKTKENNSSQTFINYKYEKPLHDEHLHYLLGPGREQIVEKDHCQIIPCLSSGYCRVTNIEQGKEIEKCLYSILPNSFNIDVLKMTDDLALIVRSSAAEYIFEQNQIDYTIISEPIQIQLNIEIIHAPILHRRRSPLTLTSTSASSSSTDYENTEEQYSSNGKFHIHSTGSSINVISGDISQTKVDMMICVSTSNNLRESILRRAGSKISNEYNESCHSNDALLLNGGSTAARKILFVPWQTEVEQSETTKTQKSLSDLVKWCIDQAEQRDFKSISFPPIGTGQLGLDPFFVCEAMISAASERLHHHKLDVSFVIYPSTGMTEEDECYQIFRIYLDNLCEQVKSKKKKNPSPTMNNRRNTEGKVESIRRNIQSKQILILSDSSKPPIKDQSSLIKSLEELIYEKTFPLSLIQSSFIDQITKIDFLIDLCLKYNVYPQLNYDREELTLQGDRNSCFQCFFNLSQRNKVFQYTFNEEKILNNYISLQIDQALSIGETNISIEDDEEMIYHIDLNKFQIRLNREKEILSLRRKELNENGQIRTPSSWSSSILMIRTVPLNKSSFQRLECFQIFEKTMSTIEWQIERIESIENYPLYIHLMSNEKRAETKLYFHGCSYASVQSIIHYGFHSTNTSHYGYQYENSSICLTRDVLDSHLYGSRPSTDGKYYLFAVQVAKKETNNHFISLSNDETCLALPTYLIVYQKRKDLQ